MKRFVVLMVFIVLAGCSGKIYTLVDPKPDNRGRIEGIIVYQPRALILELNTTHLQDEHGSIVGSSEDGKCTPIPSYEIVYIPDYGNKNAIVYDAGLFESKKFSLELDKGMLTKINNESTSGAKEALDAIKGIVGTAKEIVATVPKTKAPGGKPPCNVGKAIVRQKNIEDLPK